jgi:hypothetical protein
MSDRYIDQFETIAYGPFAVAQIEAVVIPLDPEFKKPLKHLAARIAEATAAMEATLKAAGEVEVVTYKAAADDPVAAARDVLRRAVKYTESRPDGDRLAAAVLKGETLTTVIRRRPAKLIASLGHAISGFESNKKHLPEHATWIAHLVSARDTLDLLDKKVRSSRVERRAMTPEVTAARNEWLKVYGAAKLIVEGVLKLHNKVGLLPEVFDDLAEVHRVSGVTDEVSSPSPVAVEEETAAVTRKG